MRILIPRRRTSNLKVSNKSILGNLLHTRASLRENRLVKKFAYDEPPLRSELFSSEQMKQHGKTLAGSHKLGPRGVPDRLLARLVEEWKSPDGSLQPADGGGQGEPPDCAGRGMAARQLLPDRRTDSHGQATLAEGVQPGTASFAFRPIGGTSARVRHRPGDDLARRWTGGPGNSRQLRGSLPDGHLPYVGRIVGHPDHAAPGADRESPTRWSADLRRHDRTKPRRPTGGTDDGDRGEGPEELHSGHRGHGGGGPADGELVCCGICASVAGTKPRSGIAAP